MTDTAPPARVLVTILVFFAVALAAGTAVFFATPVPDRPDLWSRFATIVTLSIAGIPGILAWLSGRERGQKIDQQLDTIKRQTNGHMTALVLRNADEDDAAFRRVIETRRAAGYTDEEILRG